MTAVPEPALLSELARRHAAERPTAPAVVEGDAVWSWAELDRRADAIADRLAEIATGPDARVGLAIGTTALGIAALHAAARAGVTAILVNPRLTAAERTALLKAAGTVALAIDPATGVDAPPEVAALRLGDIGTSRSGADADAHAVAVPPRATPTRFVVPTSGTTARPKLACLPLDRLAASATAWAALLPPATGWLLSLGLAHVAGVGIVVRAAAAGVPVVVPPGTAPGDLLAAIERARGHDVVVSHTSLVAAQLHALLEATDDAAPPDRLGAVIIGGGPIPKTLVRRGLAARWPLIPSYGLTETASGVVALRTADVADDPDTVGQPLPGVAMRFEAGEILVRGPMVFAGYLDDPEATAAALTPDGWLRTGDLGHLDLGGRLIVHGRRDDLIIRGGENISPGEVEAALAAYPGIHDVAVIGVPDPTWGQVPVAVIVTGAETAASDDDIRAFARDRLARFKVPTRFVRVRVLPRTSLGKVARPELRRLAMGGDHPMVVTTDDGQALAVRDLGDLGDHRAAEESRPVVVLLHATLSTSDQLMALARRLAADARVILVDRRGSGASQMTEPRPVPVARHAADVLAVLDALGVTRTALVGHSFGGVVALEVAGRAADRVAAVLAWEPPYLAVADPAVQAGMATMADEVAMTYASSGSAAASRRFLEAVSGSGAWERLHPRQQEVIGRTGAGALADVAMGGLDAGMLGRIMCPVILATGGASEPFYRPLADALAVRLGASAERVEVPGLRHMAPITDPDAIADLALRLIARAAIQETTP